MMNYLAKYTIGECSFKKITNPALVGIFSHENKKTPPSLDNLSIDIEVRIRRSITIGSYLGGGVNFPANISAVDIITNEHLELLETYIKTIPQEKLYFFSDGTRYSMAMMQILVQISKKLSKHVACLGVLPGAFDGNGLGSSWEVITELADESSIFDFESTPTFKSNKSEVTFETYGTLRLMTVLEKMTQNETGLANYDYFSE
ncbi:MAG: hypothetical protein RQ936_02265 [Gammaproteobacteria bacterium]|nr:hypothetical protein [Gammaproteobacteria bacterium]